MRRQRVSHQRERGREAPFPYVTIGANQYAGGAVAGLLAGEIELLAAEDALSAARQQLARLNSQNLLAELALIRALGGGYIDTPLSPAVRTE